MGGSWFLFVALQINQSFEVVAYLKRELRSESELANNEPKGNI